jgi:hypothetical protein
MLILDFSKASDVVPHERLLLKLHYYWIRGKLLSWIRAWLTTQREQCVMLDGDKSESCKVKSGVPQGTVLGPLMFLLYINDIGDNINSKLRLFADDSLLYNVVISASDATNLQKDLDKLTEWAEQWQMKFNPSKCYVLRITSKKNPVIHHHKMLGQELETVDHNPYLGLELTSTFSWDHHINNIKSKANKQLGFLRRNLGKCPLKIKRQAYISLVRPHLEYASSVWDPHLQKHIDGIEMVQRRAARFISSKYDREPGTVTKLLNDLELPLLHQRRKIARLIIFYKAMNNLIAIPIPEYIQKPTRITRSYHHSRFIRMGTNKDIYKFSFYPRTITEWNTLPPDITRAENCEAFRSLTPHKIPMLIK